MSKNNVKLKCHFSGIDYESTFLPKGGFMSKNNKSKPLTRHFQIYFKSNHPTYIVDVSYPKIKKAGSLQTQGRTRYESGTHIKPNKNNKSNKKSNS